MKTPLPFLLLCGVAIASSACRPRSETGSAETESKAGPKTASDESDTKDKGVVELVGTLHRPMSAKHAYRLEIYPAGNLKFIELIGDPLKKIAEKTPVRVQGVVRTQVVGPAKNDSDQYPVQWGVWLRVSEVQSFATLEEAFREPLDRHRRERDRSEPVK